MFGNLGFPEILIILVIVLLLFGARRIPEIAGSMGKGIREFKKNISDMERSITDAPRETNRIDAGGREGVARTETREGEAARRGDDDRPEPKRLLS